MTTTEAESIKELLQQRMNLISDDLEEIKAQTTLTNGRVKQLELRQERQKGFLAAIGLFTPVGTAVLVWFVVERMLGG
jgi:hypothetical protein